MALMSWLEREEELKQFLQELAKQESGPPLHLWDPPAVGHSKITFRRDGSWWHDGCEIKRPALRQLFASILRKEKDGAYYLDRKSTRLNSSHVSISYAVYCLKKKNIQLFHH